jgi:HPt (histidine-containing phosphotransfer) domain-containing protein
LAIAIKDKNRREIGFEAHTIKGALGNFCAHPAYAVALQLEEQSEDGDLRKLEKIHQHLVNEVQRLTQALRNELIEIIET